MLNDECVSVLIGNGELRKFYELGAGAGQLLANYSNWGLVNVGMCECVSDTFEDSTKSLRDGLFIGAIYSSFITHSQ